MPNHLYSHPTREKMVERVTTAFEKRGEAVENGSCAPMIQPFRPIILTCKMGLHDHPVATVAAGHTTEGRGDRATHALHTGTPVPTWGKAATMSGSDTPLLICSEDSTGWLLGNYLKHTRMLIYIELPLLPKEVCREPSRREDEEIYRYLQASHQRMTALTKGCLLTDGYQRVTANEVEDMMAVLTDFVGCETVCRARADGAMLCFVPRLAEIYALFWLCMAWVQSPERHLWYRVARADAEEGIFAEGHLSFQVGFDCPVDADDPTHPVDSVREALALWDEVAQENGCSFLWSLGEKHSLKDGLGRTRYAPLTLTLTFVRDPAREPWGDFKHPLWWDTQEGFLEHKS